MQEGKMGSTDEDADIRHPSINTEPRTLSESTIERALVAAQKIFANNPEPNSECFVKDAIDSATREHSDPADDVPRQDTLTADASDAHPRELVQKAGNAAHTYPTQFEAPVITKTPASTTSSEPAT